MLKGQDWSGSSGDLWARDWRDTDRALAAVGAALDGEIDRAAPAPPFRALDVGCGPGTTAIGLAGRRRDATIVGCDLSASLIAIARERGQGIANLRFEQGDAQQVALEAGPFDLILSRHGVMFFDDPLAAFSSLRAAASDGARLVFSCFRAWQANPWAAELAEAAAGSPVPAPGREPSGFAFADPDYVGDILGRSGWRVDQPRPVDFDYVAGKGEGALDMALNFLLAVGPAARALEALDKADRPAGSERVARLVADYHCNGRVAFPAAAWLWTARA